MTTEVQDKDTVQGPYRGAYRKDVYEDDAPEDATLEEDVVEEQEDEETISVKTSKKEDHDYKKRYDDLKKHYDAKLYEWKQEREALTQQPEVDESFLEEAEANPELEQFKIVIPFFIIRS